MTSAPIEETMLIYISDQIYLFQDTYNVYVLCSGREAVLIEFGGNVLDHLAEISRLSPPVPGALRVGYRCSGSRIESEGSFTNAISGRMTKPVASSLAS